MKSKKRFKLYLVLFLILVFALIVYANTKTAADASINGITAGMTSVKFDTDAIQVIGQSDKPKPKPDKDLQENSDNLIKEIQKAKDERKKDKKVSDNTKQKATKIAKDINLIYGKNAKKAREKGRHSAADFYEISGENIVFESEVCMKDEISSKDMNKIKKRNDKEQKAIAKAFKEVDPATLTPAQKAYLKNITLVNLKKNLTQVQGIMNELKLIMEDLKKSAKGKGGFGFVKKLASGGGEMGLVKSIMGFLKSLMQSIKSNIQNITRLIQA